jgi:hypothetical protein
MTDITDKTTDEEIRVMVQGWRSDMVQSGHPEPNLVRVRPDVPTALYDIARGDAYHRRQAQREDDRERDVPLDTLLAHNGEYSGKETARAVAHQLRRFRTELTRAIRSLETDGVLSLDAEDAIADMERRHGYYKGAVEAVREGVDQHWKQYREDRDAAERAALVRWREAAMAEVMTDEWFERHVERLRDLRDNGFVRRSKAQG